MNSALPASSRASSPKSSPVAVPAHTLRDFFRKALKNISKHGDTDVFPYPVENAIFYDKEDDVIKLLEQINADFSKVIEQTPPYNESQLSPVGYSGFRWVTQIDPLWNAYFLGIVLSIAPKIEQARIPIKEQIVFSYRYDEANSEKLFLDNVGWKGFQLRSLELAENYTRFSPQLRL